MRPLVHSTFFQAYMPDACQKICWKKRNKQKTSRIVRKRRQSIKKLTHSQYEWKSRKQQQFYGKEFVCIDNCDDNCRRGIRIQLVCYTYTKNQHPGSYNSMSIHAVYYTYIPYVKIYINLYESKRLAVSNLIVNQIRPNKTLRKFIL